MPQRLLPITLTMVRNYIGRLGDLYDKVIEIVVQCEQPIDLNITADLCNIIDDTRQSLSGLVLPTSYWTARPSDINLSDEQLQQLDTLLESFGNVFIGVDKLLDRFEQSMHTGQSVANYPDELTLVIESYAMPIKELIASYFVS